MVCGIRDEPVTWLAEWEPQKSWLRLKVSQFFIPECSRHSNRREHSCLQSTAPSQALILCLSSWAADSILLLALSAGNTPLHLAVMMGHKGESYLPQQVHQAYFGLCVSRFITAFHCVLFLSFLHCTFAELNTSLDLSQITKRIPESKMLRHVLTGSLWWRKKKYRQH